MERALSESEKKFVDDLLAWDRTGRRSEWVLCNLCLLAGVVVIAVAALFTVARPNDRIVVELLVPSVVVGLFLVTLYLFGGRRIRERHRLATILRKVIPAESGFVGR